MSHRSGTISLEDNNVSRKYSHFPKQLHAYDMIKIPTMMKFQSSLLANTNCVVY